METCGGYRGRYRIPAASGTRRAASCGLGTDVVQVRSAVFVRERPQRIEVQKVRALEIAVAVAQSWRRQVPCVERPHAKRKNGAMSAQPPCREPRRWCGWGVCCERQSAPAPARDASSGLSGDSVTKARHSKIKNKNTTTGSAKLE